MDKNTEGTKGITPASRSFRFVRLKDTSSRLLDAAREGDWETVSKLVHQQSSLLLAADGTPMFSPNEGGATEEERTQADEIQKNLAEVQLILDAERQNTAKQLEMVSKVKKIRNTYKPLADKQPRLQDRKM